MKNLHAILGPTYVQQRYRDERDHEAIHGICVHKDDWDLPLEGNVFDDIPEPIDPYRQLGSDAE